MADDAKIAKLEAKIREIIARPGYASALAWKQEVAELRLEIEQVRSGKAPARREYEPVKVKVVPTGGAAVATAPAAAATASVADSDTHGHDDHGDETATYMKILVGLTLLTVGELFWVKITGGVFMWFGLAVMAVIKAFMVAMFYMHLKFEPKTLFWILMIPVALVMIMMLLVIPDSMQHLQNFLRT